LDTPDIFQYLDYRKFLADWFAAKKKANPRFSHRAFARRAGQRSPSLLHHVIEGERNLTTSTTEAFCRAMGLNREECSFFGWLVELARAKSPEKRNQAWKRLSSARRFREARRLEGEGFRYLSHWYYPAIRELANRPDFQDDPEWIARTLRPKITVRQARTALEALLSMHLLVKREDGSVVPAEASVVTPHEVAGLAVYNYHQAMLTRASDALAAVHSDERHYGAVTVAVPGTLVSQLKQEIADFQERILDLCDSAQNPAERVYQLNLHLFPLSASKEAP
jgi:uncharacterized protein (TIGR02147 family)